jgi:predicted RNA-binding protein with EMAP domain
MKTKKEITKMLLDKEISFWDVLYCFMKIKKITSKERIEDFLSDMDDFIDNMK